MDTIYVKNLEVFATHGVYKKEHDKPQRFAVSVTVFVEPPTKRRDTIGGTLDYRFIRDAILSVMQGPHIKLLETLAEQISAKLFTDERVAQCEIEIKKLDLWTNGQPGITVRRARGKQK